MKIKKIKMAIKQFKNISRTLGCQLWYVFCQPNGLVAVRLLLMVGLIGLWGAAMADGTDILAGTDASLWETLNHTGKKYIYAAEGILGLAAYMKTKNLLVLTGIVVVSIFFNIILSIAGESA
jgi:TraA